MTGPECLALDLLAMAFGSIIGFAYAALLYALRM